MMAVSLKPNCGHVGMSFELEVNRRACYTQFRNDDTEQIHDETAQ
jgi:hypothetical protein